MSTLALDHASFAADFHAFELWLETWPSSVAVCACDWREAMEAMQVPPQRIGQLAAAGRAAGLLLPHGYCTSRTPSRKGGVHRKWERPEPVPRKDTQ